ncbi:unnamed protein product, partial [Symbiodinium pilosum]
AARAGPEGPPHRHPYAALPHNVHQRKARQERQVRLWQRQDAVMQELIKNPATRRLSRATSFRQIRDLEQAMEAGEYNLPPASPEAVTTKISGRGDEGRVLPATPVPELGGASAPSWRAQAHSCVRFVDGVPVLRLAARLKSKGGLKLAAGQGPGSRPVHSLSLLADEIRYRLLYDGVLVVHGRLYSFTELNPARRPAKAVSAQM